MRHIWVLKLCRDSEKRFEQNSVIAIGQFDQPSLLGQPTAFGPV